MGRRCPPRRRMRRHFPTPDAQRRRPMPNEDVAASHSANPLELVETCDLDTLFEYLRRDNGRIAQRCVENARLLLLCIRKVAARDSDIRSAKSGLKVIQLLINHGVNPRHVFQAAAHHGHVELLEAACARNWHDYGLIEHDYGEPYCDILEAAADGGKQIGNDAAAKMVFEWLIKSRTTHFRGVNFGHTTTTLALLLTDLLCGECIDAADFLMSEGHSVDLGFHENLDLDWGGNTPNWLFPDIIDDVVDAGATKSLDFLCSLCGEEKIICMVRDIVEEVWSEYVDIPPYHDEIKRWLKNRTKVSTKEHLMNAMATLDENKERLLEGEYLKMVASLQGAYRGV